METLKNSSVQFLLKVDRSYSEQQTELVLQKIKASSNVRGRTVVDRKPLKISMDRSAKLLGDTHTYLKIREDMSINSIGLNGRADGTDSSKEGLNEDNQQKDQKGRHANQKLKD